MPLETLPPPVTRERPKIDTKSTVKTEFDLYPWLVSESKFKPSVFFIGVFIGFALCVAAGFSVARHNIYQSFDRFHTFLNPTSFYYPTVSQMVALVEAKARPEQTIVIIGGNSIFYGLGQNVEDLWTKRLQTLLGPDYAVFNFALPQALPFEGAYWPAEALLKKHRKVIYATVALPGLVGTAYGSSVYGYAFWDAQGKHLIFHDKNRDEATQKEIATLPEKEQTRLLELKLRSFLDSLFYFEDLWTAVGYHSVFTVWSDNTSKEPFKPRKAYVSERYEAQPLEKRFKAEIDNFSVRHYNRSYFDVNSSKPRASYWAKAFDDMQHLAPSSYRKNAIVFVATHSPTMLDRLNDVEKQRELLASKLSVETWKKAGYESDTFRGALVSEDFMDSRHLLASGGKKIADRVAAKIAETASTLGYLK
jgi:hypothetical protein